LDKQIILADMGKRICCFLIETKNCLMSGNLDVCTDYRHINCYHRKARVACFAIRQESKSDLFCNIGPWLSPGSKLQQVSLSQETIVPDETAKTGFRTCPTGREGSRRSLERNKLLKEYFSPWRSGKVAEWHRGKVAEWHSGTIAQ
jgi:hypothetical protein